MAVNTLKIGYTTGNGLNVDSINFPSHVDSVVLVADTVQNYTVPTGARFMFFSSTANFYMKVGSNTAAVPSTSTSDGSASELNPAGRMIQGETTISLISTSNCIVTISSYK